MNNFRHLVWVLLLILTPGVQANEPVPAHINTVEQFVTAFNAHDSDAMADLVADDIEWLSIDGRQITLEVKGKDNLIESMDSYFKSCPTCRSELAEMVATTSRVSAVEMATWQDKSSLRSQRAISVYEFSDGLITSVYYFPAEK